MCLGTGKVFITSDYNVLTKHAECPVCRQRVKVSKPKGSKHPNTVKIGRH